MDDLTVIGGGLAGSEAAWQAAQQGIRVTLFEMRPVKMTGAHTTTYLSELVCSNSLGSNLVDRASGLLKEELRSLGSLLLNCAEKTSVPAGGALAVDRNAFALLVTEKLDNQKNITIVREEVTTIPDGPTIIATGPLTSQGMANAIKGITGSEHLYFYDAIAPVLFKESINQRVVFRASRYNRGEEKRGDYLNCPLDKDQYYEFIAELRNAERFWLKEFERELDEGVIAGAHKYFEGCLPVEIIAQRGKDALAYGPMRPVGLIDPHTGKRPYAVVQLRQDNLVDTLYNMVGFQTNLKYTEQKRILCMIPGLKNARFARYGQMHRNTFIYSPACLRETLQFIGKNNLFFAGQIIGVEGYIGNIATGLLAGLNASRLIFKEKLMVLPRESMLGALCYYITHADPKDFQPMKANFGLMPPLEVNIKGKRNRAKAYSQRSLEKLDIFMQAQTAHSHFCTH